MRGRTRSRRRRWLVYACAAALAAVIMAAVWFMARPGAPSPRVHASGSLRLVYDTPTDDQSRANKVALQSSGLLDDAVTAVNKDLALRYDVLVHVTANEQANADYDPNKHEVSLPYWFAQEVRNALQKAQPTLSPAELDHKTAQGMTGVLLHEFGHVMVHEYNLPVLGAEETVADTFGIIAMVYGAHQVPDIVGIVDAFGAFLKEFGTEIDAVGPPDVFDDHTPPETRSARLHCLVYGSDPKRFAAVSGDIPAADLPLCVADFKEALAGWTAVLKKHATN